MDDAEPTPWELYPPEVAERLENAAKAATDLHEKLRGLNKPPADFPMDQALQYLTTVPQLKEGLVEDPRATFSIITDFFGKHDPCFPYEQEEGAWPKNDDVRASLSTFNSLANAAQSILPGSRPPAPPPEAPVLTGQDIDGALNQDIKQVLEEVCDVLQKAKAQLAEGRAINITKNKKIEIKFLNDFLNGISIQANLIEIATTIKGFSLDALDNLVERLARFLDYVEGLAKKLNLSLTRIRAVLDRFRTPIKKLSVATREFLKKCKQWRGETGDVYPNPEQDPSDSDKSLDEESPAPEFEEESEEDFQAYLDQLEEMLESAYQSLRKVFEKPRKEIRQADLHAITSLNLSYSNIRDIAPLSGLTALQSCDTRGARVSDLAPLSGLTELKWLDLRDTDVSELVPLSGLTELKSLDLRDTDVSDLAPLSGLTKLKSLDLFGTEVSGLAPLSGLTALQSLDLTNTDISDLAPLSGLSALQSLHLTNTDISDLAPLSGLTALKSLDLVNTDVSVVAPLSGLENLEIVYLQGTKVTDFSPVAHVPHVYTDNGDIGTAARE